MTTTTTNGIFFSHAHADRPLADLLRNTLILGGIPEHCIFYSSSRTSGIPSGEDVRPYLQRTLREAGLVIELISETFLARPHCLMELGGAWTLGTPTYPIVVPPLTIISVAQQIGNLQMGILGTGSELDDLFDELHDRLKRDVGISTNTTPWNRAIREFKSQLPSKLALVRASSRFNPTVTPAASNSTPLPSTTVKSSGEVTLSNISIVSGGRGREMHGEATNNDSGGHSVVIKATFYDAQGQIVGTETAIVSQLGPADTKTFTIRDIPDHDRYKVQVDMLTSR